MKKCVLAASATLALVVVIYAARGSMLPLAAEFLDVGADATRVDCVMALPGDLERREFVAAAMARVGLADKLLITKTEDDAEVRDGVMPPYHELVRRIYAAREIAPSRIVQLKGRSQSTANDLQLLGAYLREHPTATAGLVTSRFHTRRTRWTVQVRLPQYASRIRIISAPNPKFENRTWWRSGVGFRYVILEYLKLAYYWYRYGAGIAWTMLVAVIGGFLIARRRRLRRVAEQVE